MISPEELHEYITKLQAAGVTGKAKIGDIEVTIPPMVVEGSGTDKPRRSAKAEYDNMLFAATEGLREDDDEATS
jgi:hypothetical protein